MQMKRRKLSPTTQHSLTPQYSLIPEPFVQSHKRKHSPTPQFEDQSKRTMDVYNTPGEMAIRRANVKQVLNHLRFIPTNVSPVQLEHAFNTYRLLYPEDYGITRKYFSDIVSAHHGGKIRHKKHVYSYKKRSMNKKRKSMKTRLL
jgi:hypothetical protein